MAVVEVRFSPLPAHVRTARLVASAVARHCGVAEELLDEIRVAVGEACSRAVDLHRRYQILDPVLLELGDAAGRFQIAVTDWAPSRSELTDGTPLGAGRYDPDAITTGIPAQGGDATADPTVDFLPAGFGVAVIQGLVDDVEVTDGLTGVGTVVRMSWPRRDRTGRNR